MLDLLVFPQAKKIIRFSSHWILIFSFDSLTAPSKLEGPGAMGGRGRYQFLEVDWVNFDDMEVTNESPKIEWIGWIGPADLHFRLRFPVNLTTKSYRRILKFVRSC